MGAQDKIDLSPYYSSGTIYSEAVNDPYSPRKITTDPSNAISLGYLQASFSANIPSFPLSNPFVQAQNYTDIVYLGIQHLFRSMSGVSIGLERMRKKGGANTTGFGVASPGAEPHDPNYVPYEDHPLVSVLRNPNPADTFMSLLCQLIMNWNLHGRILLWGVPNSVGAPVRFYCLPVPLCTPAYNIGSQQYPIGAWRVQQYYPSSGLSGILPTGLAGTAGAVIDAREIYELKNPHPLYRWAPYSPLVGGGVQRDLLELIDRSFWSLMSQGIKPTGIIDAPGADTGTIAAIQAKIDNEHGGANKHGRPLVIGGGDPDRPGAKWQPFFGSDGTPHSEGWDRYAGFILSLMGLDLSVVGLQRTGGFAERWAAKQDAREGTYLPFLSMISELLTKGAVRQWGLGDKGVRCIITLPQPTGYEPGEMSRDLAADGTGTVNEVRALRGLDPLPDGDVPPNAYAELVAQKLGIDEVSKQAKLMQLQLEMQQAQMAQEQAAQGGGAQSGKSPSKSDGSSGGNNSKDRRPKNAEGKKNGKGGRQTQSDEGQRKNPDGRSPKARPKKKGTHGSLGGKGNSAPKKAGRSKKTQHGKLKHKHTKAFPDNLLDIEHDIPAAILQRVLNSTPSVNGAYHA